MFIPLTPVKYHFFSVLRHIVFRIISRVNIPLYRIDVRATVARLDVENKFQFETPVVIINLMEINI